MRKFITKTLLFTVPFFCLYAFTMVFYDTNGPDLIRLGFFPKVDMDYMKDFPVPKKVNYTELSKAKKTRYKVMTIGDSFSEQGMTGYNNFLGNYFSVLHLDGFISYYIASNLKKNAESDPVQTLLNLTNGDFFENYPVDYVVLQKVERHLTQNINDFDLNAQITVRKLDSLIANHVVANGEVKYDFFTKTTLQFPLYHFPKYYLGNNYLSAKQVYNMDMTTKSMFSNGADKLLFYCADYDKAVQNNDPVNYKKLNTILNLLSQKLKQKNISLIVLPSPDKYDMYYDYIADKEGFPKPIFFEAFRTLPKDYLYIDSKAILQKELARQKDVYHFGDTHWSPIAASILANKIKELIVSQDKAKTTTYK